jgi:antimicrobial peptide system SdpB family protein
MLTMLEQTELKIRKNCRELYLWTNVYGLSRSVLAITTLLTLVVNPVNSLVRPVAGLPEPVTCNGINQLSLFCFFPYSGLESTRWIAILILFIVAIGWRPKFTAIPHWWINFSLQSSARVIDGGEQIAAILCLFIVPIALFDQRRWHWSNSHIRISRSIPVLIAISSLIAIRFQVSFIYFHSAIAKFSVPEWTDGTAIYYWFMDPYMGIADYLKPFMIPILKSDWITIICWGAMLLEILLSAALFMPKKFWRYFLILGIVFHVCIGFIFGIQSFAAYMISALILYLWPLEKVFIFDFEMYVGKLKVMRDV